MRGVHTQNDREPTYGDLVEDKVHKREDDRDSERVRPHPDDRHDVGVSIVWLISGYPTKDGEYACEDVDAEDGAHELPRGPGTGTTSNEDQPVLKEKDGQFK